MKIIAGKEVPEEGKLWIHKDVTVALFEQEPDFMDELSILDNIFHHNHPIINAIKQYEAANDAEDAELLGKAIVQMDDLGAWDFDSKVKQILGKLNIHQLQQKAGTLSGGTTQKSCAGTDAY